jgi:predicted O-methyltransferase YrrM
MAKKIQGWFDFGALYQQMVHESAGQSHFVEVGAWLGKSTCAMATKIRTSGKPIRFDVIDTWEGTPGSVVHAPTVEKAGGSVFEQFMTNVRDRQLEEFINPTVAESVTAARTYADGSLDFVFIDADHRYLAVHADIRAWLPKLKPGGVLAGHDFKADGVRRAVRELIPEARRHPKSVASWWFRIPEET